MTKTLNKVFSILLALLMMLATFCTAFAASGDIIDETKTGSITLHKYDLTARVSLCVYAAHEN